MSMHDEVLEVLPFFEADAMSAKELFSICKGAGDVTDVSTALSQLYSANKIKRKEVINGKSRFSYWNESGVASAAAPGVKDNGMMNIPELMATKSVSSSPEFSGELTYTGIPTFIPADDIKPATINVEMAIILPPMPNELKLSYVRAFGGVNIDNAISIDVSSLNDAEVDLVAAQWVDKFKAHVKSRRSV